MAFEQTKLCCQRDIRKQGELRVAIIRLRQMNPMIAPRTAISHTPNSSTAPRNRGATGEIQVNTATKAAQASGMFRAPVMASV